MRCLGDHRGCTDGEDHSIDNGVPGGASGDSGGCGGHGASHGNGTLRTGRRDLLRLLGGVGVAGAVPGLATAGGPPGKEKQESYYRRRVIATDDELVTKIKSAERATVFKLILSGDDAGAVQYSKDPVERPVKALRKSAKVEDGHVTLPGITFEDLIVRSEPFVLGDGSEYEPADEGASAASSIQASASGVERPDVLKRYSTFRRKRNSCNHSDFDGYTHLFKGASFELSKPASKAGTSILTQVILFVLPIARIGALIAGAIATLIISFYGSALNFTVGLNDIDLLGSAPFTSLRVSNRFGAGLGETVPAGFATGHVERQLAPEVLFPTGYTPK